MQAAVAKPQQGLRYIGGKSRLSDFIEAAWKEELGTGRCQAADLFAGSGAVTALLKRLGTSVHANDNLRLASVLASAILHVSDEPSLASLHSLRKDAAGGLFQSRYDQAIETLNSLPPVAGFFYREYSPEGSCTQGFERRYFTASNAMKIDAVRAEIALWRARGELTDAEHHLLLADLIRATNRIANIAGTYGCFVKHWDARALKPLKLQRSDIIPGGTDHRVTCADALAVAQQHAFDAVYLDPPYTWRHYGAYYHILETIATGDAPTVSGRTGLRPWQESKSRFCDRQDAEHALLDLISAIKADHIFLSYSSEGLIAHARIMEILGLRGTPRVREVVFPRYRSYSGGGRVAVALRERLYYVRVSR